MFCFSHSKYKNSVYVSADFIKMDLMYDEYKHNYKVQGLYNVTCMIFIEDLDYHYYHQDYFRLHIPNINIQV